jgi:hypothetical protein
MALSRIQLPSIGKRLERQGENGNSVWLRNGICFQKSEEVPVKIKKPAVKSLPAF